MSDYMIYVCETLVCKCIDLDFLFTYKVSNKLSMEVYDYKLSAEEVYSKVYRKYIEESGRWHWMSPGLHSEFQIIL